MTSQPKFENTNWYQKGAEKALDYLFEKVEKNQQFPFFKYLMQNYPDLEIEWLEIFEDLREPLLVQDQIGEVLSFIDWYSNKFPEDYHNRYEFVERDLCDYFIFKKDWSHLKQQMAIIEKNPVPAIDTLTIRLLYQLIYNGQYNMAVDFAKTVWKEIDESEELMGHAAYPFVNTIYVNALQQLYEKWLRNEPLDEKMIFEDAVMMAYDDNPVLFDLVFDTLKANLDHAKVIKSIEINDDKLILVLNIHFMKFMLHKFNLPFVFSEWIWNLISTSKIFGNQNKTENWFYVDAKALDKHIFTVYDDFIGSNALEVFGKVWGLDYVFYFLHHHQLLTDSDFEKMLEKISYFRNQMIKIVSTKLWQLTFVFDWPQISNFPNDPSYRGLFESTRLSNDLVSRKTVSHHLSAYKTPELIKKEMKKTQPSKNMNWEEPNMPIVKSNPDIGRNDPCPCGSGKKYKKCCLNKPE